MNLIAPNLWNQVARRASQSSPPPSALPRRLSVSKSWSKVTHKYKYTAGYKYTQVQIYRDTNTHKYK